MLEAINSVLGFDFGTKKTGVATGQSITATAAPLAPLAMRDGIPDWLVIERLLKEWQPQALLVGLPLNMDDTESELSHLARKFARRLHGRFNLPVFMVDERLTSRAARELLAEIGCFIPHPKIILAFNSLVLLVFDMFNCIYRSEKCVIYC